MPVFPSWLQSRDAVCQEAEELWAKLPTENDAGQAQKALEELITNPLMERVWRELYRKRKNSKEYSNPARVTEKSQAAAYREAAAQLRKKGGEKNREDAELLDFEAWIMAEKFRDEWGNTDLTEQDRVIRSFFARVYRIALDHKPTILADIQAKTKQLQDVAGRLQNIAQQLRGLAQELSSMGKILFPYYAARLEADAYARQLEQIAADCLDDATVMEPRRFYVESKKKKRVKQSGADRIEQIKSLPANFEGVVQTQKEAYEPWITVRKRGDFQLKAIVGRLAQVTYALFMKPLYGTIANVTNVICVIEQIKLGGARGDAKSLTGQEVREILGDYPHQLRPTFGPFLYSKHRFEFEGYKRTK